MVYRCIQVIDSYNLWHPVLSHGSRSSKQSVPLTLHPNSSLSKLPHLQTGQGYSSPDLIKAGVAQ